MESKFTDYEEQVVDVPEDVFSMQKMRINPDYYIHLAIIKSQNALVDPDPKIGFLRFQVCVEYIEGLCKAARKVPNDFDEKVKTFIKTLDPKEEDFKRLTKIAIFKNQILMNEIFATKEMTGVLKL